MLIDGFLTDSGTSSVSGLNIYCRLEGIDYQYMAAGMNQKTRRETAASNRETVESSRKKFIPRKLFGF